MKFSPGVRVVLANVIGCASGLMAAENGPPRPKQDAKGNPIRYAATGHVSNYDEAKVGSFVLPDPLVLQNGKPVKDAATWNTVRRPELIALYEREIFGAVPTRAPKVSADVVATEVGALGGKAVRKHFLLRFGAGERAVALNVSLYVPTGVAKPAPVVLQLLFSNPPGIPQLAKKPFDDAVPAEDIVGRGYAYAAFRYTEAQDDNVKTHEGGVQALAYAPGQTRPAAGEWGTIATWAWITSRVLDALAAEAAVDAKRVALVGHSRLGKTALWAGARDPRIALVFASCSGEMGASLARRDFGESVDDVAANFPWWLVSTFPKYAGRWNELPVDSHTLIALNAPRPVFVTGGSEDLWADPHGEFLALVGAGPVYRLLGKKDVGATVLPALDAPLISGSLGFLYHTGKHTITAADWQAFFEFTGRHFE